MSGPLEGIRILDWTIWQQGPVSTAMLGDLGAEVIKIEERVSGDPGRGLIRLYGTAMGWKGRNFYFENNNRNKKSITLDLTKDKGKDVVYRLVKKSDVFVQNFRQGVAARLGLDYNTLSRYNPRLIYATASGYGPKGPDSGAPTFDLIGLGRSGMMFASTEPGLPPQRFRGAIADQMGAIMLAYGVLAALVARERLGVGQEVDVSHLGSLIALQGLNLAQTLIMGREQPQQPRTASGNPLSNQYRCADDKWIAISMLQSDRYWPAFCQALEIEELEKDPKFENMDKRAENCRQLIAILDKVFATRTREEWMTIMKGKDLIFGPVNTLSDLENDPQAIENQYVVDFNHPVFGPIKVVGIPVAFSKTPGSVRSEAPEFGQHTEEVLLELGGYSWEEIVELRDQEVI